MAAHQLAVHNHWLADHAITIMCRGRESPCVMGKAFVPPPAALPAASCVPRHLASALGDSHLGGSAHISRSGRGSPWSNARRSPSCSAPLLASWLPVPFAVYMRVGHRAHITTYGRTRAPVACACTNLDVTERPTGPRRYGAPLPRVAAGASGEPEPATGRHEVDSSPRHEVKSSPGQSGVMTGNLGCGAPTPESPPTRRTAAAAARARVDQIMCSCVYQAPMNIMLLCTPCSYAYHV